MAINKATMVTNAVNGIVANVPGADDSEGTITAMVSEIVDGIVDEIVSNAVVTVPGNTYSTGVSPSVVLVPTPLNMGVS